MYNKLLLAVCLLIIAQTTFGEGEVADSTVYKTLNLGEITINSAKYNSDVFRLPAAASKLSANVIIENKIENLTDLSGVVPNFFMPDYGSKLTSPIYIRGVGTKINSPSVGVYVDNIPYLDKSAFNFDFQDIESIDVLRGPQGTLYGRNTLAGLINITTMQPKPERLTSVLVDYGSYNQLKTQISHNQPITEKLGMIVNLGRTHHDGFFTNVYLDESADELDSYSGRMKLNYDACSVFNTQLTLQYEDSKQAGYPYGLYDLDTQESEDVNYDYASGYDRKMFSSGLAMNANFGSVYISSATSYQTIDDVQIIDQDFTPASLYMVDQNQKQHMFAQEINVSSEKGKAYEWLFGGFTFSQNFDKEVYLEYGTDAPRVYNYTKTYDNSISGFAFYHQSVLNLGKFTFNGGLRFDYEKATLLYNHEVNTNGVPSHGGDADLNMDETKVLPKFSIKYDITENIAPYFTYTTGYNSGGFNSTFERDEDRSFDAENSYNYEGGIKLHCPVNNIFASVSAFYMDWRNQQVYQPVPSGRGSMLKNAAKSESKGFEAEVRYKPNPKLEVWGMYSYNKAVYVKYQRDEDTDYSGNYLPFAPRSTYNLGGKKTFTIDSNLIDKFSFQLQYQGFGKTYWHDSNNAWQDTYGLLSGRMSFQKKNITLSLWSKNIFDTDYNAYYLSSVGKNFAQPGKPARLGVALKVRF
ncbi:TonB-dependent receptor [Sunxiuqinia sp. A32]|uniref:TonB-dependent receptor n=1 Tax=Sunxiuqinia sp. A32 TaxID=3461496 RepID=UPI004046265E